MDYKTIEYEFRKFQLRFNKINSIDNEFIEMKKRRELIVQIEKLMELETFINKLIYDAMSHPQIIFVTTFSMTTYNSITKTNPHKDVIYDSMIYGIDQNIVNINTNKEYIILKNKYVDKMMEFIKGELNGENVMILLNKISERTTLSAKLRDILENFLKFFKPTKNKV